MGFRFLKPSATEILENQQIRKIKSPTRGPFVVAVLNHKSSGKTTVSTGTGSIMAKYRGIGKVFAIDADIAFGNMAERVSHPPASSFRELLAGGGALPNASALREHVGMTNDGLWMIGGETDTAPDARAMTPDELHQLVDIAKQWFDVIFLDCTNDLRTPMVQAVVSEANAVIIPAAMRLDSVRGALTTLDHLEEAGYSELVRQAVVVLSDIYKEGSDNKVARRLEAKFGSTVRAIRVLDHDPHIAQAGPIETEQMTLKNQLSLTTIAALLAELFSAAADRGQATRTDGGTY
ncbi:MinD/ParA family ATP-binding protein [Tsukamurella ocularis]|uniref:MinD/ParA family ATP-binding protein n=1 Tax=Tsukamurella ocularis TaxID=1970234 RepID=UPI002169D4F6|nr:hypothetical protein [Tsukamurella ocularis]MCS3853325.1 MinD-like ATPase involved in chromosome partitioning or flagellar assembly [Tsukamurella ocularis]